MTGTTCSISSCKSNQVKSKLKGETIRFFTFPKNPLIRKEWVRFCFRKGKFDPINKRVCSKHFELSQYEDLIQANLTNIQPRRLNETAIPTLFLPNISEACLTERDKNLQIKQRKETMAKLTSNNSPIIVECLPSTSKELLRAEKAENCSRNIPLVSENIFEVKEEREDDYCVDDKIYGYQTIAEKRNGGKRGLNNIKKDYVNIDLSSSQVDTLKDNFKIKYDISTADMKIECSNELLFCINCREYYQDYCAKCGMLIHILNKNSYINVYSRLIEELPIDTLEVRKLFGYFKIFTLKVIPQGVKFGPFTGLSLSNSSCKIRAGRFVVAKEKSKYLNWMQYVNVAKNSIEQNLRVFQCEDSIYYRSCREIQESEELLVCFGEEHDGSLSKDAVMDFTPYIEQDTKETFACTFCCLGFSSRVYLDQHKTVCVNENNKHFASEDLAQCSFCKIYLGKKEYLEYHMAYCREKNVRKCTSLALDDEVVGVKEQKGQEFHTESIDIKLEDAEEEEEDNCSTSGYLKAPLEMKDSKLHQELQEETKQFECSECELRTKYKHVLDRHMKRKHLKNNNFVCAICAYKTYCKQYLETHINTKHLKEFNFKCDICEYKTNIKSNLENHIRLKHLKECNYKCNSCDYEANHKSKLKNQIKSKHLKQFDYKCEKCEYRTNNKAILERHTKTVHLKEFKHSCELCEYKTNNSAYLDNHTKTKHPKEFDCYECDMCPYKTADKIDLRKHAKSAHLGEFKYKCELCNYVTNSRSHLNDHIKTKHLKEYSYKCELCEFKTNFSAHFKIHMKTKHLKEFDYNCDMCDFRTNIKRNLENHIRLKHIKLDVENNI